MKKILFCLALTSSAFAQCVAQSVSVDMVKLRDLITGNAQFNGSITTPGATGRIIGFTSLPSTGSIAFQLGDGNNQLTTTNGLPVTLKGYHGILAQNASGSLSAALRIRGVASNRNILELEDNTGSLVGSVDQSGNLAMVGVAGRSIGFSSLPPAGTVTVQLGGTNNQLSAEKGKPITVNGFHGFVVQNESGSLKAALRVRGVDTNNNIIEFEDKTGTLIGLIDQTGLLRYSHSAGSSSGTPTITAGPGAGTSATVSLRSGDNDEAHQVTLTTGTAPAAGTLATITFAKSYVRLPIIVFSPAAGAIPSGVTIVADATDPQHYNFTVIGLPLAAGTTYKWNVHVKE